MRMIPLKSETRPPARHEEISLSNQNHYAREDMDYRHNWGQQSYQKRESRFDSRFDRYAPSTMEPPRWQDLNQSLPNAPPNRWAAPPVGRDRSFTGERPPFAPSVFYRPQRWQSNETIHRPHYNHNRWHEPPRGWDQRAYDHPHRPPRPQGPSRREDPRLANRQKLPPSPKGPILPTPPQQPKKQKHHGKPLLPTPGPVAPPIRKDEPPHRKEPVLKPKEQVAKPQEAPEVQKPPELKVSEVPEVEKPPEVAEEKEDREEKDEFVSPLGSLYTDAKPVQTGKGYGIQNYKIPKKSNDQKKSIDKPKEQVKTLDESVEEVDEQCSTLADGQLDDVSQVPESRGPEVEEVKESIEEATVEGSTVKSLPADSEKVKTMEPDEDDRLVIDTTVITSEMENVQDEKVEVMDNESESSAAEERLELKRKGAMGRKKGSGELARLKEDLTDLLKGPAELGVRRTRAKTNPEPKVEEVKKLETRGRKRKSTAPEAFDVCDVHEANSVQEVKKSVETSDSSPDGPGKAKKRKKIFTPTRLSLRGRRSMYDNDEDPGMLDYFQCRECEYLGQKIVHHYVNEHGSSEIPYVAVPDSQWEKVTSAAVPEEMAVDSEVLSDLSWVPSRPSYASPVSCKLCSYSTCKRSELMEHVFVHSMPVNVEYRCSLCGLVEANYFDLLDHLADHTGEYRHRCNYCDYRVSNRNSIKSHMSSLHESQDQLFYSTDVPDASKLWVNGFACKNCKYVQMTESNLLKHLTLHPDCNEYVKFNLMGLVPVETRSGNSKDGVFVCPALDDFTSQEEVSGSELTETLRIHSASFIKNLAEKLQNPEQKASNQKVNIAIKVPPVAEKKKTIATPPVERFEKSKAVQVNGDEKVTVREAEEKNKVSEEEKKKLQVKDGKIEGFGRILPGRQSTPVKCENGEMSNVSMADPSIVEVNPNDSNRTLADGDVIAVERRLDSPAKAAAHVWKKNSWLETTISKLAGKLGGGESDMIALLDQSVVAEEDGEQESDEDEEVEEEEDVEVFLRFNLVFVFINCLRFRRRKVMTRL